MAVSPNYTPVNSINWELRDLSNQDAWRQKEKENRTPKPSPKPHRDQRTGPKLLGPRVKECRDEMRTILDLVTEDRKERATMRDELAAAGTKAAQDRRRIEELEVLVTQAWQTRGGSAVASPSVGTPSPTMWEKEKEDLFLQLGDAKRARAREAEEYAHIQTRLEARTDELRRKASDQAEEIQRLREQVEAAAQRESMHTKRVENMQRLQRRATKDRNDVLETLEKGLDEARGEAAACKKQMDEILGEMEQQIAAAEVRGRDAQLKELRALSPRAMLSFLTYPQQQNRSGSMFGWLGGA